MFTNLEKISFNIFIAECFWSIISLGLIGLVLLLHEFGVIEKIKYYIYGIGLSNLLLILIAIILLYIDWYLKRKKL